MVILYKKNAFSIIEVLTVISIILILSAMLLPALKSARNKAHLATCINNQRNLTASVLMFALDHGSFPDKLLANNEEDTPENLYASFWTSKSYLHAASLKDYIYNMESLMCPSKHADDNVIIMHIDYGLNNAILGFKPTAIQDPELTITIIDSNVFEIFSVNDVDYRHNGGTVVGFLDGHVDYVKSDHIYNIVSPDPGIGYSP